MYTMWTSLWRWRRAAWWTCPASTRSLRTPSQTCKRCLMAIMVSNTGAPFQWRFEGHVDKDSCLQYSVFIDSWSVKALPIAEHRLNVCSWLVMLPSPSASISTQHELVSSSWLRLTWTQRTSLSPVFIQWPDLRVAEDARHVPHKLGQLGLGDHAVVVHVKYTEYLANGNPQSPAVDRKMLKTLLFQNHVHATSFY